jgi:four helix bundle protein
MSKKNILKDKSFDFAIRIVNLYKYLKKQYNEFVLSQQIVASGTSIGALIREAEHAESIETFCIN